jgi:hemolysin III
MESTLYDNLNENMPDKTRVKYYSPLEERLNIGSHAIGFILSIAALILLVVHATQYGNTWHIVSFSIFGASLMVLYGASTIYHSTKDPVLRGYLRVLDHASIYVLIAGTYTPFTLVTLNQPDGWNGHWTIGWTIFTVSWALAASGIILKLFFTGRFKKTSTAMYVLMGWMIIFAIEPVMEKLPAEGLNWLVAGGIAYTVGAILYGIKGIKLNHAIFHFFVLAGSACHFIAVYFYVLPVE